MRRAAGRGARVAGGTGGRRYGTQVGDWWWVIAPAAVLVLVALCLRAPFAAVGPLLGELGDELGLSTGALAVVTALPLVCFGLVSPFAPALAARFGVHGAVLVGRRADRRRHPAAGGRGAGAVRRHRAAQRRHRGGQRAAARRRPCRVRRPRGRRPRADHGGHVGLGRRRRRPGPADVRRGRGRDRGPAAVGRPRAGRRRGDGGAHPGPARRPAARRRAVRVPHRDPARPRGAGRHAVLRVPVAVVLRDAHLAGRRARGRVGRLLRRRRRAARRRHRAGRAAGAGRPGAGRPAPRPAGVGAGRRPAGDGRDRRAARGPGGGTPAVGDALRDRQRHRLPAVDDADRRPQPRRRPDRPAVGHGAERGLPARRDRPAGRGPAARRDRLVGSGLGLMLAAVVLQLVSAWPPPAPAC